MDVAIVILPEMRFGVKMKKEAQIRAD